MKQGQISQEQIIAILQQAERGEQTVATICHAHGITETTFYRWRKKYGDLSVSEATRLRELERENARLKRLSGCWPNVISNWMRPRSCSQKSSKAARPVTRCSS